MKELKAHNQDIGRSMEQEPMMFEAETWENEKYIRLKWYGPNEESQKRSEGKRDRSSEMSKGEKGGVGPPQSVAEILDVGTERVDNEKEYMRAVCVKIQEQRLDIKVSNKRKLGILKN